MNGRGPRSHLLDDSAAEGHIRTAEHIRHVTRHFQVILAIHTWDLEGKRERRRQMATQPSSPLQSQRKVVYPEELFFN